MPNTDEPPWLAFGICAFIVAAYIVLASRAANEAPDVALVEGYVGAGVAAHGDDNQSKMDGLDDERVVEIVRRRILPLVVETGVRGVSFEPGYFSETLDKRIIRLCVRDTRGRVFPVNTLVHVALHELAHASMVEYDFDHSDVFQAQFKPILERAVELKIFDPRAGVSPSYERMCARKR